MWNRKKAIRDRLHIRLFVILRGTREPYEEIRNLGRSAITPFSSAIATDLAGAFSAGTISTDMAKVAERLAVSCSYRACRNLRSPGASDLPRNA